MVRTCRGPCTWEANAAAAAPAGCCSARLPAATAASLRAWRRFSAASSRSLRTHPGAVPFPLAKSQCRQVRWLAQRVEKNVPAHLVICSMCRACTSRSTVRMPSPSASSMAQRACSPSSSRARRRPASACAIE